MNDFSSTGDAMDILGPFFAALGTIMIIILVICVIQVIAQWKIFEKAGKPGWYSIIPIYNMMQLFEIAGMKGWYVLLGFIPAVGPLILMITTIMLCFKLSTAFGKDTGFGFGLLFLSPIFYCILAFSKDTVYVGNQIVPNQPMGMGNPYINQGPNPYMNQNMGPMQNPNMAPNPYMNQNMGPMQNPNMAQNPYINQNMGANPTDPTIPTQTNVGPQDPNNGNNTPLM